MPSDSTRRYSAPALDKGLDILELLATGRLPLSQIELAQALERTPGEIYRMLACLEERGYVLRESGSGKFRLSLRLYELAHKQHATTLLRRAARMPMEALAEETGQACHLSVQHGTSLLVMMERMPSRRLCLAVGEGTLVPLVETTSGKLLLSRLQEDEASDLLNRHPDFSGLSAAARKSLLKTLAGLRGQRILISESDASAAISDIAVPIGISGTDTSAVLATSFLLRAKDRRNGLDRFQQALLACADQINRNLGITP